MKRIQINENHFDLHPSGALYWEEKFHEKFKFWHSPARGGKEWFSLSSRQVNEFIEWMRNNTKDRNEKIEILKDLLDS